MSFLSSSEAVPPPVGVRQLASIVVFTAISGAALGIPLAVLPGFLHDGLGYGAVMTGSVLGLHAISMVAARPLAGRISDRIGVQRAVTYGLCACGLSGLLVLIATLLAAWPPLSLALLIASRVVLGAGIGLTNTGTLSWGIAVCGVRQTSRVISYNGIASFGMLGLSPLLGVLIADRLGLWSLGALVLALGIGALLWVRRLPAPRIVAGASMSFLSVFRSIAALGLALGLGSAGLGVIATFATLYFAQERWDHAAWAMAAFGSTYIGVRLLLPDVVGRQGAVRVAVSCFAIETLGLAMLWLAPGPGVAIVGAALTGAGMSLIYPALGTEVVQRVPPQSRSSALGGFSLCLDLSIGLVGPVCGLVAAHSSFREVFLCAAVTALLGMWLSLRLMRRRSAPPAP